MQHRSFSWVALVGIGLAAVIAVSAATALAARSAASPFELVATDRFEAECPDWWTCPGGTYIGTFTSGAPFCASGTIDHVGALGPSEEARRYTCSDGSGSLTLGEHTLRPEKGEWRIGEGSGRYADLRGRGWYSSEQLSEGPPAWVYRTTLQGFADADAVAPSVAFTSAIATKLRGLPGAYAIGVTLSLRDDVEANAVAYRLRVMEGAQSSPFDRPRRELERTEGTTVSGSATTTLRVWPSSKRVRNVVLLLSGSDPVGNEVSIAQSLKLRR